MALLLPALGVALEPALGVALLPALGVALVAPLVDDLRPTTGVSSESVSLTTLLPAAAFGVALGAGLNTSSLSVSLMTVPREEEVLEGGLAFEAALVASAVALVAAPARGDLLGVCSWDWSLCCAKFVEEL